MKTAIILVLVYALMQLLGGLTASPLAMLYVYVLNGSLDYAEVERIQLAPGMLLGFVYMVLYLRSRGYLKDLKEQLTPLAASTWFWSFVGGMAVIILSEGVVSQLTFLPDIMKNTFSALQAGWIGVLCLTVLGPVLEELLFRGAITKVLLQKYEPTTAILLSGMVFGVFHLNPVQVVSATLAGFFFAWLYYKTRNLLPGMLIHIFNNTLSVYLTQSYPEVETMTEWMGTTAFIVLCVVSVVGLTLAVKQLNRKSW